MGHLLFSRLKRALRNPNILFRVLWKLVCPIRKDYRIWKKMSLYRYLLYHHKNIVYENCYWMGVRAQKNPFDAWIYQEIIYEIKPDIIVEIGSAEGGSTLFFANLLDLIGKGRVISIDINRENFKARHNRIIEITGDSSSEEIVSKVSSLCSGLTVLMVHDGGHSKEQVLKDLEAYSGLVSISSYFIVEDGIVDLFRPTDEIGRFCRLTDGPLIAIEEFLRKNSNFVIDKEKERYILTYNPHGFLKRVR